MACRPSEVLLAGLSAPVPDLITCSCSVLLTKSNSEFGYAANDRCYTVVGNIAKSSVGVCQQHTEAFCCKSLELELAMLLMTISCLRCSPACFVWCKHAPFHAIWSGLKTKYWPHADISMQSCIHDHTLTPAFAS